MTICWHVDDLLLRHADPSVVTDLTTWLASQYDTPYKKLNVMHGHQHDYLRMNVIFFEPGSV